MKEIIKSISPALRDLGFKGSGQNYYREETDTVSIINFQKSSGGKRFYINLGVQPKCTLKEEQEPKKVKEYECMFRKRLGPKDNSPGWDYSLSEAEINEIIKNFLILDTTYFNVLANIRNEIENKPLSELLPKSGEATIFGAFHAATCLEFAKLAACYGFNDKAINFAKAGIPICKPQAKSLLANLKSIANT